mgnify:CR=1 FL=1
MMIKVAVPNRFQLKTVSRFRTVLMPGQGEVHYIGGADILPPPLDAREEGKVAKSKEFSGAVCWEQKRMGKPVLP